MPQKRRKNGSDAAMLLPVEDLTPEMPSTPLPPVYAPIEVDPTPIPCKARQCVVPSREILEVLQDDRVDMSRRIRKAIKLLEQQQKQLTKLLNKMVPRPREKRDAEHLPEYQRYIKQQMAHLKEQRPDMDARERMVLAAKGWKEAERAALP